MQNFKTLRQPLLGELAMSRKGERRKKEREKMPFIVATYVYASSQGQRTHSARTNINHIPVPLSAGGGERVSFVYTRVLVFSHVSELL